MRAIPAPRVIIATLVLCGLLCSQAQAIIQPRLADWQARLNRLLPPRVRLKANDVANTLPLSGRVEELQAELANIHTTIPTPTIEMYAGIKFLLRKDAQCDRNNADIAVYDKGLKLLEDYERRCRRYLNQAPLRVDAPGARVPLADPVLADPVNEQPEPQVNEDGTYVIRLLPKISPTTPRETLKLYMAAARTDRHFLEGERAQLVAQAAEFAATTGQLRRRLKALSSLLNPITGLPQPTPRQQNADGASSIEQIPPPPPFDLQTIKE